MDLNKLEALLYSQCLTSGCTGHVIKQETRVTYQGIKSLHLWREKKPDDLHTAGATISYQLSCSENHNNLWSTSEFYNSSNQVTAYHRVLLIHFVILQGRSVSVLNAKLSTFVTVTGQNYENLKVVNRICSTDCNMEIILKFEFSGILPVRRCPLRHQEQPLHDDQEHCEQSGLGKVD